MAGSAITYARVLNEYLSMYNGKQHPYNKDSVFPFEVVEILWSGVNPVIRLYDTMSNISVSYSMHQLAIFIPSIEEVLFYNIGNRLDDSYPIYWRDIEIVDAEKNTWDLIKNEDSFDFHSTSDPIESIYYDALMAPWNLRNGNV